MNIYSVSRSANLARQKKAKDAIVSLRPQDPIPVARTLPTTHSSWKALFQSGWSTSSPMPLQYSQYAGYHPNWPESMIAATLGLNPCVKRVLGGNRSLWVHAVYLGRIRSCVAVERDTLPIYWSFSSCSSPLHILTCPSAWHR